MDAIDQQRLTHAEQTIRKGSEVIGSDPQNGYYWLWSGHMLKAATLRKYDGAQATKAICSLVQITVRHFSSQHTAIDMTKHNELLILSMAVGDFENARKLGQLEPNVGNHPFDIVLNRKLRRAVGAVAIEDGPFYEASSVERGFFSDIDKVARRESTDFADTDRYWKATRKRRYGNTIFETKNLFHDALENLQRI